MERIPFVEIFKNLKEKIRTFDIKTQLKQ